MSGFCEKIVVGIVLLGFGWFVQWRVRTKLQEHKLRQDEDLEGYKKDLNLLLNEHKHRLTQENAVALEQEKARLNIEVEGLKDRLKRNSDAFHYRFSKLQEQRVELVSELYVKIAETHWAFGEVIDTGINENGAMYQPMLEKCKEKYNEFSYFALTKKIFFDRDTSEVLEELRESYESIWHQIQHAITGLTDLHQDERTERVNEIMSLSEEMLKGISAAMDQIEEQFRDILGVVASATLEEEGSV